MLERLIAELMLWALGVGAALLVTHEATPTIVAKLNDVARALGAI